MQLYQPTITGSLSISGSIVLEGPITVISGSVSGTASLAVTSSYSQNSERLDNLDSTSFVFTSSYNVDSSSFSGRVTTIESKYATTGSNIFTSNQTICGNLTTTGTITAQTINVQQVTSSIVYSCGSNIFGCSITDTQQFTGSMFITGSNIRANVNNACFQGSVCATQLRVSSTGDLSYVYNSGASTTDANFYIYNSTKDILIVRNSGCIGIGTANPTKALEIVSNTSQDGIKISGTSNPRLTIVDTTNSVQFDALTTDTEVVLRSDTNHPLHLSTNGTLRLNITNTGLAIFCCSVGIGTGTVANSSNYNMLRINGTTGGEISLAGGGTDYGYMYANSGIFVLATQTNIPLVFQTNTVNRIRVAGTGEVSFCCQVCVGGDLIVNGGDFDLNCSNTTATDARINLYTNSNVNGDRATIYGYNLGGTTSGNEITYIGFGYCSTNVQGYISIQTKSSTAWCNTMSIINGRVGIGITDPSRKLQVREAGTVTSGNVVAVRNDNTTSGAFINFIAGGNNSPSIGAKNNDLVFTADNFNGTELMRINCHGIATFSCTICAKSLYSSNVVRACDVGLMRGSIVTQSGTSITFDAFRFLNPDGGTGGAASSVNGRLYMSFQDTATGGNQSGYQYLIFTTGNGVSPGPYCFVQLNCGPVRGTNPISAISIVNDGAGGAVKIQATTAASGISGAVAYITYVGTAV